MAFAEHVGEAVADVADADDVLVPCAAGRQVTGGHHRRCQSGQHAALAQDQAVRRVKRAQQRGEHVLNRRQREPVTRV